MANTRMDFATSGIPKLKGYQLSQSANDNSTDLKSQVKLSNFTSGIIIIIIIKAFILRHLSPRLKGALHNLHKTNKVISYKVITRNAKKLLAKIKPNQNIL